MRAIIFFRNNLNGYLAKMAVFVLLSLGIIGTLPFLFREYLDISYSHSWFSVLIAVITSFVVVIYLIKKDEYSVHKSSGKYLLFFVIAFVIFIFVRSYYLPLQGWDALSLYDSRAKIFLSGIKLSETATLSKYDDFNQLYYFSYPPMTSTIHTVFYSLGANRVMIVYSLFYACYSIFIFLILDTILKKDFYKILLFLLAVANPFIFEQTVIAYTNMPAITFQIGAFFFIFNFSRNHKIYNIFLSATFLAFSNWTRSLEPIFLVFLPAVALLVFKIKEFGWFKKIKIITYYFLTSILLRLLWTYYLSSNVGSLEGTTPSLIEMMSKIFESLYLANFLEVALFIYLAMLPIMIYLIISLLILGVTLFLRKKMKEMQLATSIIMVGIFIIMLLGSLYFSVSFEWWDKIPGSFFRSNLILIPLSTLFVAFSLSKREDYQKKP